MFQRTKKFFKKGIQTFKSYFSEGYERLPKTPSYNGRHNVGFTLENFYSQFLDQWEATDRIMEVSYEKNTDNLKHKKPSMLINHQEVDIPKQQKHEETLSRERKDLVTRKLKELEILDKNNVDHVRDIQEILYLYSRLTSPIYCEMVETFFMEMYSEVFSLPRSNNSMPRTSIRV